MKGKVNITDKYYEDTQCCGNFLLWNQLCGHYFCPVCDTVYYPSGDDLIQAGGS